jgi:hypothetical protein
VEDKEVIKALGTVLYGGYSCMKCKFKQYKTSNGEDRCGLKGCNICRLALDLINRQKAEISMLIRKHDTLLDELSEKQAKIEELRKGFKADADYFASEYDSYIRAEAIKEFAERLKDTKFKHGNDYVIYAENIDNLVKEMTEGK